MKTNKWWALLMVLALSIGLLSGCSQAEMGFIDLMGEMNQMDTFETQETASLTLNKLPSDLTQEDPVTAAVVQSMLSKYSIKSNARMDVKQQVFDGTLYLVDSTSGEEKPILSYVAAGGTIYLKVDDLLSFVQTLGNQEVNKKLALLDLEEVQYVSINPQEMAALMSSTGQPAGFDFTDLRKQQALYSKLMDTLTKEAYKEYETGMVKKNSGSKYTLKIDKQAVLDNLKPFMVYSINNAEKINASMGKFLQNLDKEELAMLSLTPEMRTAAVDGMSEAAKEIAGSREEYLAKVDAIVAAAKEGSGIVDDKTGTTIEVEKLKDGSFTQELQMDLVITNPANPSDSMDISLEDSATVKKIDSFTVDVPNTGVISMTELQKKMPRVLKIDTTKKQYILNQGLNTTTSSVDVRIIKGRTYLPVRTIGEAMNEKVGWNPEIKQAYIVKNGKTLNLKGAIFNSRAFIQIRDFEKLGYKVTWDGAAKTATLSQ